MCKLKLFFARLLFNWFSVKRLKDYQLSPDTPDARDFRFSDHNTMSSTMQEKVDLREFCSPVEDQSTTSSCVAQSLVGMLEFLDKKRTGTYTDLSRLFVYYTTRLFECNVNRDAGSHIRDGIKVLKTYGVCSEDLHPFVPENYALKPSDQAFEEAKNRKITAYYRIESLEEMLQCLNDGYMFVGALRLYQNFSEAIDTGIVPSPVGVSVSAHAVGFVGYDLNEQMFLCRNSWGLIHGDLKGYFKLPFSYMQHSFDLWTIR